MSKKVVFLDLKKKVNFNEVKEKLNIYLKDSEFISFTPYSLYVLEKLNISNKGFHFLNSTENFRNNVLSHILELEKKLEGIYLGMMMDFIKLSSHLEYEKSLIEICHYFKGYEIIYISDTKDAEFDFTNNTSLVHNIDCQKVYINRMPNNISMKKHKNISFAKIINKLKSIFFEVNVGYDWQYYISIMKNKTNLTKSVISVEVREFESKKESLRQYFKGSNFKLNANFIIEEFIKVLVKNKNILDKKLGFFTWVSGIEEYFEAKTKFSFFYQHGNYFYLNMIFKYSEILPANINFVFNDYTKKLFEELGAKKVYSVGSILFNKPIKERKKKYDFLYITQGHDYLGNLQYVDFPNSLHSFDGHELYQRHKSIIDLFGTKFKDKKIIIKVHPGVVTTGVYVPFWELAESYPNITINVSIPIHTLIEKSKYIISDYFTTEFINRELHYKRDIILFQGAPTPLPEETIEDMKKMFILVDTVEDLEEKVKNIENITKDRQKYDDIIEYYSSKKCDTKKVVTEILEKELNART